MQTLESLLWDRWADTATQFSSWSAWEPTADDLEWVVAQYGSLPPREEWESLNLGWAYDNYVAAHPPGNGEGENEI